MIRRLTEVSVLALRIEQSDEVVNAQPCLTNDRAERSTIEHAMVRHHRLRERIVPPIAM
ncbi:MAG: hypothetical protein U0893_19265 [Chloroflexota bacterium]